MQSIRSILRRQLLEASKPKVRDLEGTKLDPGNRGKKFEDLLLKAFDLVGLKYQKNRTTGAGWDFSPQGTGWRRLLSGKDINVKVAGAKWLFGSSEFTKVLPWDEIEDVDSFDQEKAALKVKGIIKKKGIHRIAFLRPKSKVIEQQIIDAVKAKNIQALEALLVKTNFRVSRLGTKFDVRVSVKDNKIGSIAVDKGGRVFMRSERPRKVAGSLFVGFRVPRASIKKGTGTSIKKEG